MASKYVPPHIRNKPAQDAPSSARNNRRRYQPEPEPVKVPEPVLDTSDKSFPQLGNGATTGNKWVGTKSFATLATEWKDADETKEVASSQVESFTKFQLPRFTNVPRYHEDVSPDYDSDEIAQVHPQEDNDEGWTEVKAKTRKVRREKSIDQLEAEREADEEAAHEDMMDSCWNKEAENDTTTVWK
jgi:hypothetical protein